MSKLKLSLLLFISFILVLSGFLQRHALACEFIEYSSYSEISPNVFVGTSFNFDNKELILSAINQGKSRVNDTFGNMISNPKVVITSNEVEASYFGSNAYGRALGGGCLILGSEGQNIDVIAHEYTHIEVYFRVGWLNHFLNVPTWFNEGIATLVDFRKPYLLENIDLSTAEINTVKENTFTFELDNYQASRVLVKNIDKSKLYENLDKLNQGQDINSVFTL